VTGLQTPKSVGIFGHYGNFNLGDEAIITAVIENLRERLPDVKLICLSINPADSEKRYGIPSFPIRNIHLNRQVSTSVSASSTELNADDHKFSKQRPSVSDAGFGATIRKVRFFRVLLKAPLNVIRLCLRLPRELPSEFSLLVKSYRVVKSLDLLFIAGSNQFLDNFGGPWGFPYTLLKWSIMSRLAGVQLAYVSVGAGPLDAALSKFMCRLALSLADFASFRDAASQQMMNTFWLRKSGEVAPDLAFSLKGLRDSVKENALNSPPNGKTVAINMMAMYDPRYWCEPDLQKYEEYLKAITGFVSTLVRENFSVFFFGTQKKDEDVIADVLENLKSEVEFSPSVELARYSTSVYELMSIICSADYIVATRFHGTVLSLLAEKPTLGICYYRKAGDLLKDMGQGAYALPLDGVNSEQITTTFKALASNRCEAIEKIRQAKARYQNDLETQYDTLLAPFFLSKRGRAFQTMD
jgi:polysaccharide pyruvyl transferase WcaK-like protein